MPKLAREQLLQCAVCGSLERKRFYWLEFSEERQCYVYGEKKSTKPISVHPKALNKRVIMEGADFRQQVPVCSRQIHRIKQSIVQAALFQEEEEEEPSGSDPVESCNEVQLEDDDAESAPVDDILPRGVKLATGDCRKFLLEYLGVNVLSYTVMKKPEDIVIVVRDVATSRNKWWNADELMEREEARIVAYFHKDERLGYYYEGTLIHPSLDLTTVMKKNLDILGAANKSFYDHAEQRVTEKNRTDGGEMSMGGYRGARNPKETAEGLLYGVFRKNSKSLKAESCVAAAIVAREFNLLVNPVLGPAMLQQWQNVAQGGGNVVMPSTPYQKKSTTYNYDTKGKHRDKKDAGKSVIIWYHDGNGVVVGGEFFIVEFGCYITPRHGTILLLDTAHLEHGTKPVESGGRIGTAFVHSSSGTTACTNYFKPETNEKRRKALLEAQPKGTHPALHSRQDWEQQYEHFNLSEKGISSEWKARGPVKTMLEKLKLPKSRLHYAGISFESSCFVCSDEGTNCY